MVLETSSVNFELKSEAEQDVLIDSFQNFLNSLPCKLQILIRVRELDVETYLEGLSQNSAHETESVYKKQLKNYQEFVTKLISGNKILSRRFYVVISFQPTEKSDFSLIREQTMVNTDIVIKGLEKIGMKAKILDSLELLNLFYTLYTGGSAKVQQLMPETIKAISNYGNIL